MKTHKTLLLSLLSVIANVIRLITRPMYLAVTITLIALFPAKKLKVMAPLEPSNIKDSQKDSFVSREEIIVRTRRILGLNLNPNCHILVDKKEYFQDLKLLNFLEYDYCELGCPDPRDYIDDFELALMQDWEIEQEMKPIKEKELKERQQLLPRIDFLSARIPKLCYCSLEYWPYQNPTISQVPSLLFNYLKSQRLNNRKT